MTRSGWGQDSVEWIAWGAVGLVCVECLMGKQKKPILFKVTEQSRPVGWGLLLKINGTHTHRLRLVRHAASAGVSTAV